MLKMRRVVVYLCLVFVFILWGDFSAYAAEDVAGFEKAVYNGILSRTKIIDIEQYDIHPDNVYDYYYDLYYDYPQLFGADWKAYTPSDDKVLSMRFEYKYTEAQMNTFYRKFNAEVNSIVNAAKNLTPVEKLLYVHDYFVANYSYDYVSFQNVGEGKEYELPGEHYTAIGVMVNKVGVCQGYALAYKYVVKKLGIEAHMITSDAMDHAWNVVKLNGQYYHIDATWDDPVYDTAGKVEHDYFLVSDKKLKELGYHGYDKTLYPARSTKYDGAFWRGVSSAFTYYRNKWYYINTAGVICRHDFSTNKSQTILSLPDKRWQVRGSTNSYYRGIFSTFRIHNNKLYFNTKSKIYCLNVDTRKATVAKSPSTKAGYIYGLGYQNGQIVYQIKTKPSEKGALYSWSQAVVVTKDNYFKANEVMEARAIASAKFTISTAPYTGKATYPSVVVAFDGVKLKKNVDYKLSFSNNIKLGTGKVAITGIGNYSGTVNKAFKIALNKVTNLKTASRSKNAIKLTWSKVVGAKTYKVYQYNAKTKKYVYVGQTASNVYLRKGLSRNCSYSYKVIACNGNVLGSYSAVHKTYTSK